MRHCGPVAPLALASGRLVAEPGNRQRLILNDVRVLWEG